MHMRHAFNVAFLLVLFFFFSFFVVVVVVCVCVLEGKGWKVTLYFFHIRMKVNQIKQVIN